MLQELKKQEQELLKQRQPHLEEVRRINKLLAKIRVKICYYRVK